MKLAGYEEVFSDDTAETRHIYQEAVHAFKEAVEIFESSDFLTKKGWKEETEDQNIGANVYSRKTDEGKLFSMRVEVKANYEELFRDLFDKIDTDSEWNPNVERITWLGDQSDIAYHAMSDFWVLKGRDMLTARIWRKMGDTIIMSSRSVNFSMVPPVKSKIRAEMNTAAGRFSAVPGRPDQCFVEYIINYDLKGWFPKPLLDAITGKILLSDAANLRKRALKCHVTTPECLDLA